MRTVQFLTLVLVGCASTPPAAPDSGEDDHYGVAELRADEADLAPLFPEPWVARWLGATEALPEIAPRTVTDDGATKTVDETGLLRGGPARPRGRTSPHRGLSCTTQRVAAASH